MVGTTLVVSFFMFCYVIVDSLLWTTTAVFCYSFSSRLADWASCYVKMTCYLSMCHVNVLEIYVVVSNCNVVLLKSYHVLPLRSVILLRRQFVLSKLQCYCVKSFSILCARSVDI